MTDSNSPKDAQDHPDPAAIDEDVLDEVLDEEELDEEELEEEDELDEEELDEEELDEEELDDDLDEVESDDQVEEVTAELEEDEELDDEGSQDEVLQDQDEYQDVVDEDVDDEDLEEDEALEEDEDLEEDVLEDASSESDLEEEPEEAAAADDDPLSVAGNDDARDELYEDPADAVVAEFKQEEIAVVRDPMTGPPVGLRRADALGLQVIDALAGRSSVLGFGFDPITEAIQNAAEGYLGDAAGLEQRMTEGDDDLLLRQFQELLADDGGITAESILLCSSADMAVESAIALSRRRDSDAAYRTIALVGSDHGRSGVCRTASGRPELHEGYGPMMAGFAHVPAGDLEALSYALDEQTAAVLLCPIDFSCSCRPLDADYLVGVRDLCDQHSVMLLMDESRLCFASSGKPLAFTSAADITADAVILGGGLFGGLAGGVVLASRRLTGRTLIDTSAHPMLAAVVSATLAEMKQHRLPESATESSHNFALALAELVGGFEFVRDLHVSGMTIGIETDIVSSEIVAAAGRRGLRVEAAGETGIRIQLPLVISDEDRELLLGRFGESMEQIERSVADVTA